MGFGYGSAQAQEEAAKIFRDGRVIACQLLVTTSILLDLRLPHGQVDVCIWGSFGAQSCFAVSSFILPWRTSLEN